MLARQQPRLAFICSFVFVWFDNDRCVIHISSTRVRETIKAQCLESTTDYKHG